MNTDASFTIGDSHLVCEDYALSSDNKIVVCDGCSSSEMTDVGARLLALTAMSALDKQNTELTLEYIKDNIIELSHRFRGYPDTMFDATLLMAKSMESGTKIVIVGDGVLVLKRKKQDIKILNFEYLNGYPYYINYEINSFRRALYFSNEPELKTTCNIIYNKNLDAIDYDNGFIYDKNDIIRKYYYDSFVLNDTYEWIALMSDGVHTFRDEDRKEIPIEQIISELTNFKTFTGEFVKRRLNKFKKDCVKKGWTHYDDLSMAVIYLGK